MCSQLLKGVSVSVDFEPTRDRFLVEHTQYGRPLLPAVMAAELIAQSALAAGVTGAVRELRNVTIHRPFGFSTDAQREVTVTVGQQTATGEVLSWDGQLFKMLVVTSQVILASISVEVCLLMLLEE